MEPKKQSKKGKKVVVHLSDTTFCGGGPIPVAKVVGHYRRTGRFKRRDLRQVLGDRTKGVSAGKQGLQELIAGE